MCAGDLRKRAEKDLWNSILGYAYLRFSQPVIETMQRIFTENKVTVDEFVMRMFGVFDHNKRLDRKLGDKIILLHQTVQGYDKSVEQLNGLIHLASTMENDMTDRNIHMNHLLLNDKFAQKLYELICTLAYPKRVYSTFVEAAQTCRCFCHVDFHLQSGMSSPNRTRPAAAVPISSTVTPTADTKRNGHSASSPPSTPKTSIRTTSTRTPSQRSQKRPPSPPPHKAQPKRQQSDDTSPPMSKPNTQCGMTEIMRPYLSEDDLQALAWLEPASKKHAAELVIHLRSGRLFPPSSHAWYIFGFPAARNSEEESYLAGTYNEILKEAPDKQAIFRELTQAVETNTLVQLFEAKEYGHIRDLCPHLEAFLNTSTSRRPSTFRLRQFLQDEGNTEPPAILRRDYGFKYCVQREEVQRLKVIYTNVLNASNIRDLHIACVNGRLHEFAVQLGVPINAKDRRLMQNDYPACIGYDNDDGLAAYSRPLFKTSL
jgi:hypothetical protein